MKRFRILMLMTALLASATMANAQAPSNLLPFPRASTVYEQEAIDESQPNASAWYVQAAEQTVAAWQRLRSMCQSTGCCETQAKPGACKGAATCVIGAAGCAGVNQVQVHGTPVCGNPHVTFFPSPELMQIQAQLAEQLANLPPCCDIKGFIQVGCGVAAQKAAAGCGCAKGCGCCETCKAKGAQTAQRQPAPMVGPYGVPVPMVWGSPQQAPTWTCPMPNTAVPSPHWTTGLTPSFPQVMPAPRMVIGVMTSVQQTKPAHLVTPELEAHCQRIIHKDGTIILEGNVLLLCKKHAQPIRIEAPRVIVNMKDGSFVVDSGTPTVTTNSIGVLRPSVTPTPMPMIIPVMPSPESIPGRSRIIQVVPVPQDVAPR